VSDKAFEPLSPEERAIQAPYVEERVVEVLAAARRDAWDRGEMIARLSAAAALLVWETATEGTYNYKELATTVVQAVALAVAEGDPARGGDMSPKLAETVHQVVGALPVIRDGGPGSPGWRPTNNQEN